MLSAVVSRPAEHLAKKVVDRPACFVRKMLIEKLNVLHSIEPEEAEITTQLAPGAREPDGAFEPKSQRSHSAASVGASLVMVPEAYLGAAADRGAKQRKIKCQRHPTTRRRRPQRPVGEQA